MKRAGVRQTSIPRAVAAAAERIIASRFVDPPPAASLVALADADDVILLCSRQPTGEFHAETWSQQLALAHELAARGRTFAITDDPATVFEKSVAWALPPRLVEPRLWNYAGQVQEFAAGLEAQGNRMFLSAAEAAYWENKAYMHKRLAEVGAAVPATLVVDAATQQSAEFEFEPAVVKEEHSAGSAGIHFFGTVEEARSFVSSYRFRPGESLIVQQVVPGATRDLRLTMVGDEPIRSATYWRVKSPETLEATEWRTTATTYGSAVIHEDPPGRAVEVCATLLRELNVRTAGFDLMWENDDLDGTPLILELSPFYQPNPPLPARASGTYKTFKSRRYRADGYFKRQHLAYREIAAAILDKGYF